MLCHITGFSGIPPDYIGQSTSLPCSESPIPSITKYFRPEHTITSALLLLSTDIEMEFNNRKPPDRTVCVAVDVSFDTVCHDNMLTAPSSNRVRALLLSERKTIQNFLQICKVSVQ